MSFNTAGPSQKVVMVVDDDESVRSFIGFSLKSEGYTVLEERSAISALKTFEKKIPHLILLDINMPSMDGFTLCNKIRENPKTTKIPIIFITAHATPDYLQKAKEVGGQGLIEKPLMFNEFLLQVNDALTGKFTMPTRLKYS